MKKFLPVILIIASAAGVYFLFDFFNSTAAVDDAKTGQYSKSLLRDVKEGDIIFQTSNSSQSEAIQIATNSKYSHMGIIYIKNDKYFVFEAVQPVKLTPLKNWILRGVNSHFVLKRLKERDKYLTPENISKMRKAGESYSGKNYDLFFSWSDEQIYCSELVWKIYNSIDLEIGKLQRLKDFYLTSAKVVSKLEERYGENIPWEEKVVSPAAIFNSDMLETVISN